MSIDIISHAQNALIVPSWLDSSLEVSELWPALTSGRARIVDSGTTEAHHFMQFESSSSPAGDDTRSTLTPHRIGLLERALRGESPKVIAMDVGRSTSTVAANISETLRAMGVDGGRIPVSLVLLYHALRGKSRAASIHVERATGRMGARQWLTCARPEFRLGAKLSDAELSVISLMIEGKRHHQIARARRTSQRTVANQVASAYRKLGISGRMDLLCYLCSELEAKENAN